MLNPTIPLFTWVQRNGRRLQWCMVPAIVTMMAGVFLLVYVTGGIKYVFSHSMYIPIMLGGLVFGMRGGILMGLAAGLILGPFMPIDTATGEMQLTVNWLYRMGFFVLIGFSHIFQSTPSKSPYPSLQNTFPNRPKMNFDRDFLGVFLLYG